MTSAANGPAARVTLNASATMAGAGFLLLRGKAAGTARMENFRAFDESADFAGEDEPAMEAPPEIGIDERRMHVRAYNYWVSLLDGRSDEHTSELQSLMRISYAVLCLKKTYHRDNTPSLPSTSF